MSRKKQVLFFIILIPVFLFSFMRLGSYFFTAEDVFYDCERGLGYGPSDKILAEYDLEERSKLIVGKWNGDLSVVPAEPAFVVLWKLKDGGVSGFIPCEKIVTGYLLIDGKILGLVSDREISEVICQVEYGDYENPLTQKISMAVDKDGFFIGEWGNQNHEEGYAVIAYIEGINVQKDVIYRDGVSPEGVYYNNGVKEN